MPDEAGGPPHRRRLRGVVLPAEHGGWSLTLEPVVLGLLVEPSWSGVLLGGAALVAFLARTPMKLVLGDRRRGRRLPRTEVARRAAVVEAAGLVVLVAGAAFTATASFWLPLLVAAPLVVIGFGYDVRSQSRRLVPELVGSIGIGSVAAAIVLAGGGAVGLASAMWLVVAARAGAAILHVRVQLRRAKQQEERRWQNDLAQVIAVAAVGAGTAFGRVPVAGLIAVGVVSIVHILLVRRPPYRTPVIGAQQVVIGLTVVLATGLGAIAP